MKPESPGFRGSLFALRLASFCESLVIDSLTGTSRATAIIGRRQFSFLSSNSQQCASTAPGAILAFTCIVMQSFCFRCSRGIATILGCGIWTPPSWSILPSTADSLSKIGNGTASRISPCLKQAPSSWAGTTYIFRPLPARLDLAAAWLSFSIAQCYREHGRWPDSAEHLPGGVALLLGFSAVSPGSGFCSAPAVAEARILSAHMLAVVGV